ncbi:uncharacterized protein B0H18DRAFT_1210026 [Fomitopsis serialis]|uniref:uncharacterized protein n=1 Tax=Fomitopsis serialis TaxID=139415 RepID=UPI002008CB19|nr:uncharacterized protein B0H18DRAFT_1210026 [Neoantrodia serialis]KAH9928837.1 hypothetical protein B0H18DRAFT_1210026 [Neoantrodia serialis]
MATDRSREFASIARMPLDESLYDLREDDISFLKAHTGIDNDNELKEHVMKIQVDAYQVYPYRCIRYFWFAHTDISLQSAYAQLLKLGQDRPGAIFLEIPCAFGNDLRKAIYDGFPQQDCVAADLEQTYWQLGHRLFKSTTESFPVPFVPGDIFDVNYLASAPPFYVSPASPAPALSNLTNLTPLQGHVSAIHAAMFFHLFDEEKQLILAQRFASLLSPVPGSLIFGRHYSAYVKGARVGIPAGEGTPGVSRLYCHSPESWTALWNGGVFKEGTVKVEVELKETQWEAYVNAPPERKLYIMLWSVIKI